MTRGAAAAVDGLLVGASLLVAYATLAAVAFMADPLGFRFPDASWALSLSTWFLVLVLYLATAWSISGRTYGCVLMGLRVVDRRGRTLRLPRALARAFLCAAFPIGLLWCVFSGRSRSVQDLLVRSAVIYDWQPRGPGRVDQQPDGSLDSPA